MKKPPPPPHLTRVIAVSCTTKRGKPKSAKKIAKEVQQAFNTLEADSRTPHPLQLEHGGFLVIGVPNLPPGFVFVQQQKEEDKKTQGKGHGPLLSEELNLWTAELVQRTTQIASRTQAPEEERFSMLRSQAAHCAKSLPLEKRNAYIEELGAAVVHHTKQHPGDTCRDQAFFEAILQGLIQTQKEALS